jgi:hypothetical protein
MAHALSAHAGVPLKPVLFRAYFNSLVRPGFDSVLYRIEDVKDMIISLSHVQSLLLLFFFSV